MRSSRDVLAECPLCCAQVLAAVDKEQLFGAPQFEEFNL